MKRKLNIKLIRKIQKHITEEPRRFAMSAIASVFQGKPDFEALLGLRTDFPKTLPPCKTIACVAGYANILSGARKEDYTDLSRAAKKIGVVTYNEMREQGNYDEHHLFDLEAWPEPYRSRYEKAKTPKVRAKIACERLDHLIETGE